MAVPAASAARPAPPRLQRAARGPASSLATAAPSRPERPRGRTPAGAGADAPHARTLAVGRTAGAVSGLAESGIVHRLTRGRLWIGLLATLLVGIVALNVLALGFSASASRPASRPTPEAPELDAAREDRADGRVDQQIQATAATSA